MKILSVTFQNLNSLAGRTTIDFTAPAFDSGVFLITGPTGSGKTTILDAITLALFGQTGRQGKLTATVNEAMNRDAGFCSSSVDFIGVDDKRYRATWAQARARQKVSGRLQSARRSLVALDDGERDISEHKMEETAALIARKLGFTFEEFTRTVILEQGQFDSFLNAPDKERGAILEKATRTDRFSRAGRAIFAAWQWAAKARDAARSAYDHFSQGVLSPEKVAELAALSESLHGEKTRQDAERLRLEKILRWQQAGATLRSQGEALRVEREAFVAGEEPARRKTLSLERAKKARSADPARAEAQTLADVAAEAREGLARQAEEIARREAELPGLKEKAEEAARVAETTRAEKAEKDEVISRARELDGKLRQVRDAVASTARALADSRKRQEKARADLAIASRKGERLARLALFADDYQREPCPVPEEFSGASVIRAIDARREAGARLEAEEKKLQPLEAAAAEADRLFSVADEEWPALLEALDGCVDRADQVVQQAGIVASLADHRAELVEGEPCPLCGAIAHPYAQPGAHVEALDEARGKLAEAKARREEARDRHDALRASAQAARARHDRARLACQAARTEISRAQGGVERELESIRASRASLAEGLARLEEGLASATADVETRSAEATEAAEPLAALEQERKAIPFADPEAEARRLQRLLDEKEKAASRAAELHRMAGEVLAESRRAHDENRREAAGKEEAAQAARTIFESRLDEAGFEDETSWRAARLGDDVFAEVELAVASRREEGASLDGRETDLRKALALHDEERPDALLPLEEAEAALGALREASAETSSRLGEIAAQLARNTQDEEKRQKAYEEMTAATAAFEKWNNLNNWLGGERGKCFRVYAQGRTLDQLLTAAEPHLARMSNGRFSFLWNPSSGSLKPELVDHFLADEVRPVSNLSGGETFMVSLALTLGLSGLSGERFSVGSLFLDEGFGTLDGQCLDLALTTLSKLNAKGCLVGIISHVDAVKECIPDHIEIKRTGPGVSVATGAGVTTGPASL